MKHKTLGTNGIATATVTEQSARFIVTNILLLKNDDTVNDLFINLNTPTTSENTICLKPGESIEDLNMPISSVYYKSSASTVSFRLIGCNYNE